MNSHNVSVRHNFYAILDMSICLHTSGSYLSLVYSHADILYTHSAVEYAWDYDHLSHHNTSTHLLPTQTIEFASSSTKVTSMISYSL